MRWSPGRSRLAAAFVAGLLAVLLPVAPVAAQPSAAPNAPDGMAKPPPLDPNYPVPTDDGQPDLTYERKACGGVSTSTVVLPNKPWGQTALRFDDLHKFATGKGQSVAVIDTGVSPHDFLKRLVGGGDYVTNAQGLEDCDGHGTEVAGIIAASPPAGGDIGFKGIAPDATIVSIRQSSGAYEGTEPNGRTRAAGTLETLAKAIMRAADRVPHGVINMSVDSCRLASLGPITKPEKQVQAALRYAVDQQDVVPVASAGNLNEGGCPNQNNGPDASRPTSIVIPPWFSDDVISVAAMDRYGDPAKFSVQGPWVSVAAPGTEITSLDPFNRQTLTNRSGPVGKQTEIQGTSFAAPYVAGLAALIRERFKDRPLTARQVMNRIRVTASHPAATGGRDTLVGYGMINPIGALTAMVPSEQNIAPDAPIKLDSPMGAPVSRDWTPMRVALIGALGGVALLLLTLFVVHTVRRNRREPGLPDASRGW
ncbi:MAG: type VII secretion-associated serine protease mycosin [Labedaea sp.]